MALPGSIDRAFSKVKRAVDHVRLRFNDYNNHKDDSDAETAYKRAADELKDAADDLSDAARKL